jgi:zinc/manganese transport system substrate-binding protein
MPSRRILLLLAALAAIVATSPATAQDKIQDKIKVVATFSILGDLVQNVGGDRVEVTTLVGPDGDTHVFSPSPADAKKVAAARLVFVNGLGFEGWLNRLVRASKSKRTVVVVSQGVKTLRKDDDDDHDGKKKGRAGKKHHDHEHGDVDPHAWQSVANAKVYVTNIRNALIKADPAGKDVYEANAKAYLAKLDALEQEVKAAIAKIPADRRKIITNHDAFGYFGAAYGIAFISPAGSTDADPSAKDVAKIITQIKEQKIPAVFLENISDPRLMQQIARETGAKIGGTLYSDALTDEKGQAPTYIDLIRHNTRSLNTALQA